MTVRSSNVRAFATVTLLHVCCCSPSESCDLHSSERKRRIGRVVLALWRHVDVAVAAGRDGTHVGDVAIRLDARQLTVLVARAYHSVVAGTGGHRGNRSGLGVAPADEEDDKRDDGKKQERANDDANDQRRVVRGVGRHHDDVGGA
jgi:hypothetical protein